MAVPPGPAPTYPSYSASPQIRFDAISEAWRVFQPNMGPWIVAELIFIAGMIVAYIVMIVLTVATTAIFASMRSSLGIIAIPFTMFIPIMIFAVAFNTLMGGMYRMAIRSLRGETISAGDLFSVTDVLPQLLVGSLLSGLIVAIGSIFCYIPGLIAAGLLMFTVPLIVDKRMNGVDAMKLSFETLKPQMVMATLFYFVAVLVGEIGGVACGIGILFTLPLLFLSVAINYRDFFMTAGGPGPYAPPPPPAPSAAPTSPESAPATESAVPPSPAAPSAVPETPPPPPDTPGSSAP